MEQIKRTSAGLRELLFEQLDGLRRGSVPVSNAKAVAQVSATILKSVEVEMAFIAQRAELSRAGKPMEELGGLTLATLPAPAPEKPGTPRFISGRAQSGSRE